MAKTTAQIAAEGVEDLVLLPKVTEEGIVDNIKKRYMGDKIYTNIGPVLISVNPFKRIPNLCDDAQVDDYKNRFRHEVPPNIFALAEEAYRAMKNQQENQCVIITGESGAGKTEAAKLIMRFISAVSGEGEQINYVKNVILESNPLLEAFGNAKTLRNNNSSRFGKYFEIQFDRLGDPVGGKINHYLLEKSRVVKRIVGERAYHIFYQFLAGADAQTQQYYQLYEPQHFGFLNQSECYTVDNMNDLQEYRDTVQAMNTVGITADEQGCLWGMLAGILHLGNVYFVEDAKGNAAIHDDGPVQLAAQMFATDANALKRALTFRTVTTGIGDKAETYNVPANLVQAYAARDSLAKTIYSRIFDFIVEKTNQALSRYQMAYSVVIGVLDIYGFEIFKVNGFEQFCINYVNEKLQQLFIELTLRAEQEEYSSEGIQWTPIKFFNNKIVCELIEGKKPPGIFSVLDDVCATMHSEAEGVDYKFLDKISGFFSGHLHFRKMDTAFEIKHYAGEVVYEVAGFCEKNKDAITNDLIEVMQCSQNFLLVSLFPEDTSVKQSKRPTTAGFKIKTSAQALIQTLSACTPHYVRTIKPNETKRPLDWDEQRVQHQVKYLGLLENVRVRRAGFAYRAPFERFVARYKKLSPNTWGVWGEWTGDMRQGCQHIVQASNLDAKQWQLGKTKIFIRHPESLFFLEECLERHDYEKAALIQKAWRRWKGKKKALEQRALAANLLRGKKERRRESVSKKFDGDYVRYDNNFGLQAALVRYKDERVLFADQCVKFNRRTRPERRDLIVTPQAFYMVMRMTKNRQQFFKMTRRVPLDKITQIGMSTLQDGYMVVKAEGIDVLIECPNKTEFVTVIHEQLQARGLTLSLNFADSLQYTIRSGDTRTVRFQKDESAAMPKLKKEGKTLTVFIQSGMDRNTDTTPQNFSVGMSAASPRQGGFGGGAKKAASPQMGGGAKKAASPQMGGGVAKAASPQMGGGGGGVSPAGPKKGPAPAKAAAARVPQCRALYDYPGTADNELSFRAGDVITIVQKDPAGWWEGELQGRRGWIPANYVQEI
eukprot:TRINITY_DN106_c0_g2_i1.p1 TRINITY_DN106_c0_g2~~TRINITY_DN106_c0_g2_i1.p1  ORF type:complete len:1054 (-),score=319.54 TRINITY_DN106_c0_g2_i1:104-3265(-)